MLSTYSVPTGPEAPSSRSRYCLYPICKTEDLLKCIRRYFTKHVFSNYGDIYVTVVRKDMLCEYY